MPTEDPAEAERAAFASLTRLSGLTWHPIRREDLSAVAGFFAACEEYDENPERWSPTALEEYWDSPRSRPEEDTLVAYDGHGSVAAVGWAGCNRAITERRGVHLGGAVRPDRRGAGIGRLVLAWEIAHAHAWDADSRLRGYGPLVLRLSAPVDQTDVRHLAERHGLAVERYFFEMTRPGVEPPDVRHPDGVDLVDWDPARSAEVHETIDLAFRDHWGHADRTPQMWQEVTGSAAFRSAWSVLAVDRVTGRVVGAALNCAYEQDWAVDGVKEGYTDELGVLRSHRGRGIAAALLAETIRRFAAAGMEAAALGVDSANPSGALRLYERLGYRRTAATCIHQADFQP